MCHLVGPVRTHTSHMIMHPSAFINQILQFGFEIFHELGEVMEVGRTKRFNKRKVILLKNLSLVKIMFCHVIHPHVYGWDIISEGLPKLLQFSGVLVQNALILFKWDSSTLSFCERIIFFSKLSTSKLQGH